MSWFVVDVESDGPCPGEFSMVCFGAVHVADLSETFYGQTAPITTKYNPEALAISGIERKDHEKFPWPGDTMNAFRGWVLEKSAGKGMPIFVSDNPAFDWQFINYYFHAYTAEGNPFGYSARRIGDLYCGLMKDTRARWKHLRHTKHDHNPVNDATGNAEALLEMEKMGLKLR